MAGCVGAAAPVDQVQHCSLSDPHHAPSIDLQCKLLALLASHCSVVWSKNKPTKINRTP